MLKSISAAFIVACAVTAPMAAWAEWQPNRPVEFVAAAGPGGGTDTFARVAQSAINKNNLLPVPIIVTNKPAAAVRRHIEPRLRSRLGLHLLVERPRHHHDGPRPAPARSATALADCKPQPLGAAQTRGDRLMANQCYDMELRLNGFRVECI